METVFPDQTGYAATVVVGFRKSPGRALTERVGTVVLKRTYLVDPAVGGLMPAEAAEDVLLEDQTEGPGGPVRRESDVAPFKPESDVVVLGFNGLAGLHTLRVNGQARLRRAVGVAEPPPQDLFGCAPRSGGERRNDAGTFSDAPEAYPPEWPVVDPARDPLPADFDNRFFNGYSRTAAVAVSRPFRYLPVGAVVRIARPADPEEDNDYRFSLTDDAARAVLHHYAGNGPDVERHWLRQEIAMPADTLVIEPAHDRCSVVWRGVWDADAVPEERLRRLLVVGNAS